MNFGGNRLIIELWPSGDELTLSEQKDKYRGPLTEFYESIESLYDKLRSIRTPFEVWRDAHFERGQHAKPRAVPPEIVELVPWLTSSGTAFALYKLLRLWADLVNGRKIKIVIDGKLEVEATQLTKRQVLKLIGLIQQHRKKSTSRRNLQMTLKKQGFLMRSTESHKRMEEQRVIKNMAQIRDS
jgi:hypothetical protein